MPLPFVLFSTALGLSVVLALTLAILSYQRLGTPGTLSFFFGNLACAAYSLGTLLEIGTSTTQGVLSSLTLEYLGITTIGPLWLLTALAVTGEGYKFPRWAVGALFVLPGVFITLVATNDFHHLFYSSITLGQQGPFTVPKLGKGPFYLVNMAYMNITLLLGFITTARGYRRAPHHQRPALGILLIASLLPWSGMVLYQSGLSPWGLDTAPIGLTFSTILHAVALFRFRLFHIPPLAKDQIFENMKEGVLAVDEQGRILGTNPALQTMLSPYAPPLTPGKTLFDLAEESRVLLSLQQAAYGEASDLILGSDDQRQFFQVDRSPLLTRRGGKTGDIIMLTNITQRELLREQLALQARTDGLTGLPNRRCFLDRLTQLMDTSRRYRRPFSLALVDLDHFKAVNDTWGHEAGDQVLVHLSRLWSGLLRSSDTLARYGGEEFTLLLPETGESEVRPLLERLRKTLAGAPLPWGSGQIVMTASFGVVAGVPNLETTESSLLALADKELYAAKASGRNRIHLTSLEITPPTDPKIL